MSGDPYEAFARDVPETMHEDVMTMLAEAAHDDDAHDCVTILDRDRRDVINVRVGGIIEIEGREFSFQLEDGNWNGTVLLEWESGKPFEYSQPARWALQPVRRLVDEAVMAGKGPFLIIKWDAMLKNRPELAELPGKYAYDRFFQPGGLIEKHYRDIAAAHHFEIVSEETAAETRARLAKATPDA